VTRYRAAGAADVAALAVLGRETFIEAFGHLYGDADLNAFLGATKSEAAMARALADPAQPVRIAEDEGRLVGYCKLGLHPNFADYPAPGKALIELKELYIRASHHGTGVAQAMMDWALDQARAAAAGEMVLSVWSGNARGQAFYRKYGFDWVADTHFMVGSQRDAEYLFMKPLGPE
jgi:diamine N-acetyltransferase